MKRTITMTVNGDVLKTEVEPRTLLIDCLRDELGITGPKIGCVTGKCGACNILLNGVSVKSCMIFAVQVDGADIVTVEGIHGDDNELHPIQEAFKEKSAVQCGYCTPGMIVSAYQLSKRNLAPSDEEIKEAIGGNICRCTGYVSIIDAVKEGCKKIREKR